MRLIRVIPRLAHALNRARLIEHWGTGTLQILEACKGYDLEPEFLSEMGCFITRMKKAVPVPVRTTSEVDLGGEGYPPSAPQVTPSSGPDRRCCPSPLNFPLLSQNSNEKRRLVEFSKRKRVGLLIE